MPDIAVLEELLAVVGGDDDERGVLEAAALERREERAEMVVELAQRGVVEIAEVIDVGGARGRRRPQHDVGERLRASVEAPGVGPHQFWR